MLDLKVTGEIQTFVTELPGSIVVLSFLALCAVINIEIDVHRRICQYLHLGIRAQLGILGHLRVRSHLRSRQHREPLPQITG